MSPSRLLSHWRGLLLSLVGIAQPPLWLADPDLVVPTLVAGDAGWWTPMVALICKRSWNR